MTKEDLRIVYMGTPDFAVESLRRLVEGGYNVVGVITMPDKPMGRHQDQLSQSAVKKYAVEHGLRLLQPVKLKDPDFIEELRSLKADLQIVVAFRMLPEIVWAMPRLGTFNLHASLLPQYRGAAPINWAVINGDTETGITTFFLQQEIDTGNIIQQVKVPILDTDNVEDVHDKLMMLGGDLVLETVDNIIADNVHPIPQEQFASEEPLRPAPKIFKETCQIDWACGVKRSYDFIRGLSPYPAAWTTLVANGKEQMLKIFKTEKEFCTPTAPVGTVLLDGKKSMKVALKDGYLNLLEIQLAGKKRMRIEDFLRGFHAEEIYLRENLSLHKAKKHTTKNNKGCNHSRIVAFIIYEITLSTLVVDIYSPRKHILPFEGYFIKKCTKVYYGSISYNPFAVNSLSISCWSSWDFWAATSA